MAELETEKGSFSQEAKIPTEGVSLTDRIVISLGALALCPVFGAVAMEFARHEKVWAGFFQNILSLSLVMGAVLFSFLAICCLIGAVGMWSPEKSEVNQ